MESRARSCRNRTGRGRAAVLGLLLAGFSLPAVPLELSIEAPMIGASDPFLESVATLALRGAVSMLSDPGCRQVFTEFSDASGMKLQSRLDSLGHTPESYLRQLRFTNGRGLRICQWNHVLAATVPNSQVILLCGAQFSRRGRIDPRHAAALLIHEELHSLGLGENPPSSQDITARVLQLCGRRFERRAGP